MLTDTTSSELNHLTSWCRWPSGQSSPASRCPSCDLAARLDPLATHHDWQQVSREIYFCHASRWDLTPQCSPTWGESIQSTRSHLEMLTGLLCTKGNIHLQFHSSGNHYVWSKVTSTVHNIIVGKLWIDQVSSSGTFSTNPAFVLVQWLNLFLSAPIVCSPGTLTLWTTPQRTPAVSNSPPTVTSPETSLVKWVCRPVTLRRHAESCGCPIIRFCCTDTFYHWQRTADHMPQLDCRDLIVKAHTSSPWNSKVPPWSPSKESSLASGGDCCRQQKTKTERHEATASLFAAREISEDATVDTFLAQPDDIFTMKEEQKTAERLLCVKGCFGFTPCGLV